MYKKINKKQIESAKNILIVLFFFIAIIFYSSKVEKPINTIKSNNKINKTLSVAPVEGVEIPVRWNNFGSQMIKTGVIDSQKFESIYQSQGGLTAEEKKMLYGLNNGNIVINQKNSNFILNMLWGFGLGNKNPILEKGEMSDPKYGGTNRFASTGGWTISKGNPMNHYSKHSFVILTK